jgi:hypothetical protein
MSMSSSMFSSISVFREVCVVRTASCGIDLNVNKLLNRLGHAVPSDIQTIARPFARAVNGGLWRSE